MTNESTSKWSSSAPVGADALEPPPDLEDRIVGRLRHNGLLRPRREWRPWAAAAAVFLLGVAVGGLASPRMPREGASPRFLMLLYPGTADGTRALDREASTRAHRAWLVDLRTRGVDVDGERLATEDVVRVGSEAVAHVAPQGYFFVYASSLTEAVDVARSSPHAVGGGVVVVQAVDTPGAR